MPRATVIGASGFIGRHLVTRLRRSGWVCSAPGRHDRIPLDQPLGTLFYCAGLTADFAQRPHDTVRAHVTLLDELLAGAQFDALVYLSSTRLYDRRDGSGPRVVDETTPLSLDPGEPRHLYDLSKALGESLCHQAGGGRARVARLSCVYAGADDPDGFLGSLLRRLHEPGGAPLEIESTAHAERDYVRLADVLDALILIATRGTQPVYNVAGGANVGNAELFARLAELTGRPWHALGTQVPPPPPRVSIDRMRAEFGWQPAALLAELPRLVREVRPCCR